MTITESERAQKVATVWKQFPEWTEEEVFAQVESDLRREAEERVEADARSKEFVDSFISLTTCPICLTESTLGRPSGLCEGCGFVVAVARAERIGAQMVAGKTKYQRAEMYLDQREGV